MIKVKPRHPSSQSRTSTTARTASPVIIIRTTCGSQSLYSGQLTMPGPRFGHGAGGAGPVAAAASHQIRAARALETLEKRLVTAVIVQAEQRPAHRDRKPGDGPCRLARPAGQAETQTETQRKVAHVMHHIIEVNPIQAGRASPASNLAVDVIEPETQMSQRHAQHEPRSRTHPDRDRRSQGRHPGRPA